VVLFITLCYHLGLCSFDVIWDRRCVFFVVESKLEKLFLELTLLRAQLNRNRFGDWLLAKQMELLGVLLHSQLTVGDAATLFTP
jgi:hypothetical protein